MDHFHGYRRVADEPSETEKLAEKDDEVVDDVGRLQSPSLTSEERATQPAYEPLGCLAGDMGPRQKCDPGREVQISRRLKLQFRPQLLNRSRSRGLPDNGTARWHERLPSLSSWSRSWSSDQCGTAADWSKSQEPKGVLLKSALHRTTIDRATRSP